MRKKMTAGWYMNGSRSWYWDGRKFTDWLDENAMQMSYGQWSSEEMECNSSELAEATNQVEDIFVTVSGPYDFDDVCDGRRLLKR